jgi:hypothetical protein
MTSRDVKGNLRARPKSVCKLPPRGKIKTYLLTSAQNNTGLHEACWENLLALAAHDRAEIMVASFTYATASRASVGQKKTAKEGDGSVEEVWDERVVPYLADRSVEIAPGLVWCGELQILPTAVNPLSGLASYTGRASSIVPHVTFAVESVASPKHQGCKFLYTTGTVTLRNYIEKKAGQKASFHHGYGALIVQVRHDGAWYVRQLNADSEGVIYDLDRKISHGRVTSGHRPEAIVWGDIHTRQLEPHIRDLGWGERGILDLLRPRRQVLHDVLDFRSQNHHDRKDPWKTYAKHVSGGLDVYEELAELAAFLDTAVRPWCETVIVRSNHDEALVRWLKEVDFREDPLNAEVILDTSKAAYQAMRARDDKFCALKWSITGIKRSLKRVKWLHRDEDYVVCAEAGDGLELGMHGDIGPGGSRGSLVAFAKSGRKCIVGHSHVAGLRQGAMQVPVMGSLDQGYNQGQSSWSQGFGLVYANGKRTLCTIWKGRAWA